MYKKDKFSEKEKKPCPRCAAKMRVEVFTLSRRPSDLNSITKRHRWFKGWHCTHCGNWIY